MRGVFHVWAQQSHHHIEELTELMNAQMGSAITHISTLSWVDELLQNTAITCALLTSQGWDGGGYWWTTCGVGP